MQRLNAWPRQMKILPLRARHDRIQALFDDRLQSFQN